MKSTKLAGLGLTALKSNFTNLGRPYKLTFSITYWCQSRCTTCNIWEIRPKGELSLQEIQEFAKKNNHFKWITITGGEPFMRGDIVEVIRAFKDNSKDLYLVTMPTNSLCNPDMVMGKVEQIMQMGVPRLSVTLSLDGYREMHDKIRGVPGNYDKVMDMARRMHELQKKYKNLYFVLGYTVSKFNQGQLAKTIEEVKKDLPFVTPNDFHINIGQLSDIYYNNNGLDIRPDVNVVAEEVSWLIKNRKLGFGIIPNIEGVYLRKMLEYIKQGKTPITSKSLDASLFLDSYGNVYPSIMWGRKIGSLRESNYDLAGIWHNADAEEVRKLIKEGKEPVAWTACEAYQTIVGNLTSFASLI